MTCNRRIPSNSRMPSFDTRLQSHDSRFFSFDSRAGNIVTEDSVLSLKSIDETDTITTKPPKAEYRITNSAGSIVSSQQKVNPIVMIC